MRKKQRKQTSSRRTGIYLFPVLAVIGIAAVAYWNSFDVPMVFDDAVSVEKNVAVRTGAYFSASLFASRSLLYLSFAANYLLHGQSVWGYHLVNFILHVLNGVLVFFIADHIFRKVFPENPQCRTYAIFAVACFLAHPIQTESVTYISSRSELLSTFFYALGLLVFMKWPERKIGVGLSGIIVVLLLCALGGKETAITLPAVLLLYDSLFLSPGVIRALISRWRFYGTFLFLTILGSYYILSRGLAGSVGFGSGLLPPWAYFLTETRVLVRYIQLLFIPVGQTLDHDIAPSLAWLDPAVLFSVLLLLGVLAIGWYCRKRQPIVAFSIFWFFITLGPTSSFVPIADVMVEHRLYLPLVGVCLSFPLLVARIIYLAKEQFTFNIAPETAFVAITIGLIGLTVMRNEIWRDEVRLWSNAVDQSPFKMRPYLVLSAAYTTRGEYGKAIEVDKQAVERLPQFALSFYQMMGNAYLQLAKYDEAAAVFEKSAELSHAGMAYNNLGLSYLYIWDTIKQQKSSLSPDEYLRKEQEILSKASVAFEKGWKLDPNLLWALDSWINVQVDLGRGEELQNIKPGDKEDFNSLYVAGKLRFLQNRFQEAVQFFERASRFQVYDQTYKLFYFNYGYAADQIGDLDLAVEEYTSAVKLDPAFKEAYINLAIVLFKKNDLDRSLANFKEVLRLDPNHISSNLNVAKIYLRKSQPELAKEYLRLVLSRNPGNVDAATLLRQIGS